MYPNCILLDTPLSQYKLSPSFFLVSLRAPEVLGLRVSNNPHQLLKIHLESSLDVRGCTMSPMMVQDRWTFDTDEKQRKHVFVCSLCSTLAYVCPHCLQNQSGYSHKDSISILPGFLADFDETCLEWDQIHLQMLPGSGTQPAVLSL